MSLGLQPHAVHSSPQLFTCKIMHACIIQACLGPEPKPLLVQAFASFMGALACQPAHVEALTACAALQKACGFLTEAVAALELAREAAHDNAAISEALAAVLTDIGEPLSVFQCSC